MSVHILLVDDEEDFREMVALGLEAEGYRVTHAADGEQGLAELDDTIDVLISDVNMPRLDGFALCRKIRDSHPLLPVILLTTRDSEIDEALGLDLGADDYITKPVSNRVLIARIRASMRRRDLRDGDASSKIVSHGAIELDVERLEARVGGDEIELTVTEFRLFRYFVENAGKVLTRERLLRSMRDDDSFVSDRMVDSYVNRLRRKIEAADEGFDALETVIGMGYRLRG